MSVFSVLTLSQKCSCSVSLCLCLWLNLFTIPFLYIDIYYITVLALLIPPLRFLDLQFLGLSIILFSQHLAWHLEPSLFDSYRRSSFGGRRRCFCPPEYPCLLSPFEALPEELRQSPCFVEVLTSQIEKLNKESLIYFSKSVYKTDICTSLLVACHISYPGQELKLVLA